MRNESRQIAPPAQKRSVRRVRLAWITALAVDALQLGLFPLVASGALSPFEDVLDVATTIVMTLLLGWHWAFLPTFIAEIVPFVDLVPTWTLAVLIVTRGMRRDVAPRSPGPP